jgi:large conductance mechanosensitive channel
MLVRAPINWNRPAVPVDRIRIGPGASTKGIFRSADSSRTECALAKQFDISVEQKYGLGSACHGLLGGHGFCFAGLAAGVLTTMEGKMLQEFKKFAMRGSVVDLAIGVIIGAAFGKIIDSMVNDILMPIIGRIFGGLDFKDYFIGLTPAASQAATYDAAKKAGATLGYGSFITVTVNFLIIAWILFLVIKGMNRLFVQEQAAPPPPAPPTKEQELLTEIRDLLKVTAQPSSRA